VGPDDGPSVRPCGAAVLPRQDLSRSQEANGAKLFWGRGNGWVLAGLARTLAVMPKDYPRLIEKVCQSSFAAIMRIAIADISSDGLYIPLDRQR